ncbi:recombinase family protein [Sphingopyxis sp. YR583]|uniref:recombinase family protein n=1 Tax=Sphingopyxis sp. YR583 TaxID=1881047 RepID=UPI0015A5198E|nr:recombinase family protein [Sphingopyxis sp. YR583]
MSQHTFIAGSACELTPAAQYIRMSTEHQRYSPDNQRTAIAAFAARRGFDIVETYIDAGRSGLTLARRPALKQLFADVLSGQAKFRAILVLDVSRWGRFQDTDQSAHYEYMCRAAGVQVHYCTEPFDNDGDPLSSMMKHMKRVMAAEYSRELSVKISRAQRQQAGLGYKQGGDPPLGLRRQVVDESGAPRMILARGQRKALSTDKVVYVRGPASEIALVRNIFRLFVEEKLRLGQIEKWLNARDKRQANGKPWTTSAVRRLLMQDLYAGRYVFGKRSNNLGRPSYTPPSHWVTADVMVPVVTNEIFRAAERRLKSITRRVYSTEEIETGLERLLAERGHLSGRFIQQCSYLPSPEAIDTRYGSLAAAFRTVGFEIPSRIKKNPAGLPYSDDELLNDLRRIYQDRGYLSGHAVDADSNSPSKKYFVRRFGSLAKAFELAGVEVTSTEKRRAAIAFRDENGLSHKPPKKAARRNLDGSAFTDDQLLGHLRRLLREHGYLSVPLIDADPEVPAKNLFRRRFGGLRAAYARVGFFSSQSDIVRAAHARLAS